MGKDTVFTVSFLFAMKGLMNVSYGKYGMKNIGGGMPNNMMGIAYNDPWFAAGALLAQNWNKNYEDRGNKKAIDAALAELSPTGNAQEQQLATQQFQGMQPQGDTLQGRNMLGIGAGYTVPTGKGLLGGEIPAPAAATGTGLFGSMSDLFPSMRAKEEQPKQGLFESIMPPKPEKDLIEQVKEDAYAKGGLLSNAVLTHKLLEAGAKNPNAPLTSRELLGLTPPTTDAVPRARELLGLQDVSQGTGLFGSVFPDLYKKKEEPKGGLLTNAMINYYLSENGPTPKPKAPEEAAPEGKGLFGSVFPGLYQKEEPKGGLLTTAMANYHARSPLENTSSQMLRDYLGDYSLGKDAEGNTMLNKSQGIGDIAQSMANQRLQNFDANQWTANKQLALMRQGYTPEQIGYIMEPLAQKAAGIQQEQYRTKAGEAIDQFFKYANAGDFGKANAVLYKASHYDPDMINKILSGSVAPKDVWSADTQQANALERMGKQYELGQQGADAELARRKDLTTYTAQLKRDLGNATLEDRVKFFRALGVPENVIQAAVTGVGKTSGKQTVSPQYKAASDYVRNWQTAHKDDLDDAWKNDSTYQTAMAIMQAGFMPQDGGSASGGMRTVGGAQFNRNNYPSVMEHATAILEANKKAGNKLNKNQLMDMFRFYYGDFGEKAIQDTDWTAWGFSGNSQPVQQQEMVPDEDWRGGGVINGVEDNGDEHFAKTKRASERKPY